MDNNRITDLSLNGAKYNISAMSRNVVTNEETNETLDTSLNVINNDIVEIKELIKDKNPKWITEWPDLSDSDPVEFVDLGLSVLWASCNLGATTPTEFGKYFQWADTIGAYETNPSQTTKNYDWETTTYCNDTEGPNFSKYNDADDKVVLDSADDAAIKLLGSAYRMPTKDECQELLDSCNYEWVTNYQGSGVDGGLFTSRVEGHINDKIFIPAAGYCDDSEVNFIDEGGYVWSSSLYTDGHEYAFFFAFRGSVCGVDAAGRYSGLSIRAVKPKN